MSWHLTCSYIHVQSLTQLIILVSLVLSFAGCSNIYKPAADSSSLNSQSLKHSVVDNLILSIGLKKKLVSFDLNFYGEGKSLEKIPEQKKLVKSILASHLSELEINDIKNKKHVNDKLVKSFNRFFADVKISKLEISKLKEL